MLVIDVGNTNIDFAWTKNVRIFKRYRLPTSRANKTSINKIISFYPKQKIIVCSVVPPITKIFKNLREKVHIVGEDVNVPIACLYDKREVGMDRLVGAYAAKKNYSRPRLIIDFGTAITFDLLSKEGKYQGGLILPGIGSTLYALSSCALLPDKILLKKIKKTIPTNTQESISKGVEEGFSSMLDSLVKKYKKKCKISSRDSIIVTGGQAPLIASSLSFPHIYEPFLVLKGLLILGNKAIS